MLSISRRSNPVESDPFKNEHSLAQFGWIANRTKIDTALLHHAIQDNIPVDAKLLGDMHRAGPCVRGPTRKRQGLIQGISSMGTVGHE